eukprot:tig00000319_g24126.t1
MANSAGPSSAAELLSEGFLANYTPVLDTVERQLHEVMESQRKLLAEFQEENTRPIPIHVLQQIHESVAATWTYSRKIAALREEMMRAQERADILMRRTVKLRRRAAEAAANPAS